MGHPTQWHFNRESIFITMNYWLMKTEPETFSIDDLLNAPKKIDHWEGVRNYQARNYMRDAMKLHDLAFFYHSNCDTPGIAGMMEIVREKHPDLTALDPHSAYFDPKSTHENPRWWMVSVKFIEKFNPIIPLRFLKNSTPLQEMILVKPGNRLSVMPVTAAEWKFIISLKEKSL
jgi:predicted RNA-binding protein with PUA-like domain